MVCLWHMRIINDDVPGFETNTLNIELMRMDIQNGLSVQPIAGVSHSLTPTKLKHKQVENQEAEERKKKEEIVESAEEEDYNKETTLNDTLKFPPEEVGHGIKGAHKHFIPKPPSKPKPPSQPQGEWASSPVEINRRRKLKISQENLTDVSEISSSAEFHPDELVDLPNLDHSTKLQNGMHSQLSAQSGRPNECVQQETGRNSSSNKSDSENQDYSRHSAAKGVKSPKAKSKLPTVTPTQPLPPLDMQATSHVLRTTNKIDQDCMDYAQTQASRFARQRRSLSDGKLQDSMVPDNSSVSSMKSSSTMRFPILCKDIRKRNYLEGSLLSTGALLGSEELDRHFPNRKIGIYVVTWNMQGRKELPENLNDFLLPSDSDFAQDMYVVGTQESCPDRREWEIRLQETLGPQYVMLSSASHGVLYLAVFMKRDLIWFCSEVEHAFVTTRIVSQIKTKGAVGVCFTFFGTSFLFVTSHFTLDVTTRFDEVLWFGDLNFRLANSRMEIDLLLKQNLKNNMSSLLQYDQLLKEMQDGSIFNGFREAVIGFLPTYKFDVGCDTYDSSAKQRIPSYTDRIVYKSRQQHDIHATKYACCTTFKNSDHRPVYGIFQVKLRPGRDNIPLCAGHFDRVLYLEGIKRRLAREISRSMSIKSHRDSLICTIA
nr:PREDICTED: 72 kDa inositol polyphosphate 5-phosphatase isoform X2 [Latimeria chalumnae]|eukprot:XP_014346448.1 PREDICTED: 72 kDa inositol polyphosphate 5-phosphatase isoform X2 [Latimeria chalumnae]